MKKKNPYQRLLEDIKEWCLNVRSRHEVIMWLYPKNRLNEGWTLHELYERTRAAEQLGYEIYVTADDRGLHVLYRKKLPTVPYAWEH